MTVLSTNLEEFHMIHMCPPESVIEQGMRERYEQPMMIVPLDVRVCVVLAKTSSVVNPITNHHPTKIST